MYFYCLYELIINHQVLVQLLCANILLSLSEINTYLYSELLYPMVTADRSNGTSWAPAVGGGGGSKSRCSPPFENQSYFLFMAPFMTLFYFYKGPFYLCGEPFLSLGGLFWACSPPKFLWAPMWNSD